jgi:hypothetical protein
MAERKTEQSGDGRGNVTSTYVPAVVDNTDKANLDAKMKATNLGSKAKSGAGMPKQNPGEDPAAYSARLRKWREGNKASTQASALEKK